MPIHAPHPLARPSAGIRSTARTPLQAGCLLGALGAALPGSVCAADGDSAALPEVTVTAPQDQGYLRDGTGLTRLPGPLRDIPQSITVVPQQIIEEQGATTLREALRNVSGISFNGGEGGNSGDNINLRGFTARNDLFLDGVRDSGSYTRDIFNIEAVEVLKGPSSMVFGRGTTGGAINQTSKRPWLESAHTVGASLGTLDLRRLTVDFNEPLTSTAAFRLNGMWQQSGATPEDVQFDRYGIAPSLTLGLGTDTEVNFSYFRQKEDNVPYYGVPYRNFKPVDVDKKNFYGLADHDFENTTVDIGSITVDHRFNDSLSFRNSTRYARYDRSLAPSAPRIAGNPPDGTPYELISVNRSRPYRDGTDTTLANQTDITAKFTTGSFEHKLVGGVEIGRETTTTTRYQVTGAPQTNLAHPDPDTPAPLMRVVGTSSYTDASANTFGVYAIDEIALTPEWKVVGGLRWDRFAASSLAETYTPATGTRLTRDDRKRTDTMTSGRIGVIWQPSPTQSYYAAFGTSFNPTAETLTISSNNAGLDPEENHNFEIGAKLDFLDGALSVRTALFRTEKINARTLDPDQLNVNVLDGRWVTDGIELDVIGRITPQWSVFAGLAFMDPEITESNNPAEVGKRPANAPRHTLSVWTTYDLGGGWEIGGGVQGAGKRYGSNTNTNYVPGYTRWDAEVAYKQPDFDVRLNVVNLTDTQWYEAVYTGHAIPGTGRAATLSVDYRF